MSGLLSFHYKPNLLILTLLLALQYEMSGQHTSSNTPISPAAIVYSLPAVDEQEVTEKRQRAHERGQALEFAIAIEADINCDEQGSWTSLSNGTQQWECRIESKGAYSLNYGMDPFYLPEGAQLEFLDKDGVVLLGPLSSDDNHSSRQYWTPVLKGDLHGIRLTTPIQKREEIELNVKVVNHDYLDIATRSLSGSCNLDVICSGADGWPQVDAYRDMINAVGAIVIDGKRECTGVLINSTRSDGKPYFLTADHCGIFASNEASVVVHWNYQNSYCRQPNTPESGADGDGTLNLFNSGSNIVASSPLTDFVLLELDDPIDPSTDPFFAGWELNSELSNSAFSIHHPLVEEKRISFSDGSADYEIIQGDSSFIFVNWEIGTTELGSSGAPLFDDTGKILGQLNGGDANCNNNAADFFGWIRKSWDGATASSRLRDWLDPDRTGVTSLSGMTGGKTLSSTLNNAIVCTDEVQTIQSEITVSESFEAAVNFQIDNLPDGINARFSTSDISPGTSIIIIYENIQNVAAGSYNIEIIASNNNERSTIPFVLKVSHGIASSDDNRSPRDNATNTDIDILFEWEFIADQYHLQVAEDPQFATLIVDDQSLIQNQKIVNRLDPKTKYYWRVKGRNACGNGEWSPTFDFTTGDIFCNMHSSTDTPVDIEASSSNTILSEINIMEAGLVRDMSLSLIGRHTWIQDLKFSLRSPSGTEVVLAENICGGANNFDFGFDDNAENVRFNCPVTDQTMYVPAEALSKFDQQESRGVWTLIIDDQMIQDGGALDSWQIEICTSQDFNAQLSLTQATICDEESLSLFLTAGKAFTDEVELSYEDPTGLLSLDFNPNSVKPEEEIPLILSNLNALEKGSYFVDFRLSDGENSSSSSLEIIKEGPESTQLVVPTNTATEVNIVPTFEWTFDARTDEYQLLIFKDANLTDTLINSTTPVSQIELQESLSPKTTYYWKVVAKDNCGRSSSEVFSFTTESDVGVVEIADLILSIFPNPAKEVVYIEREEQSAKDVTISIYSMDGQSVMSTKMSGSRQTLDVSTWGAGMYLVKIEYDQSVATDQLVILP